MAIQIVIQASKSVSPRKLNSNRKNPAAKAEITSEPVMGTYTIGAVIKCRCGKEFVCSKPGQLLCSTCQERAADLAKADATERAWKNALKTMVSEGRTLPRIVEGPVKNWNGKAWETIPARTVGQWEIVAKDWTTKTIPARGIWKEGVEEKIATMPARTVRVPKGQTVVRGFGQSYTFCF